MVEIRIVNCHGCERAPFCNPAKWHWEGNKIVCDIDGTLCIENPSLEPNTQKDCAYVGSLLESIILLQNVWNINNEI